MEKEEFLSIIHSKIKSESSDEHLDFVLPGFLAKGIVTYQGMISDIRYIAKACEKLKDLTEDEIIKKSLWISIIALYGRQFTDASNSSLPKLEIKDCFPDDNEELLKLHHELIQLRHNYVAHRGDVGQEYGVGYFRMAKSLDVEGIDVRVRQVKLLPPGNDKLQQYLELFRYLEPILIEKYKNSAQKALRSLFKELTPDQIALLKM